MTVRILSRDGDVYRMALVLSGTGADDNRLFPMDIPVWLRASVNTLYNSIVGDGNEYRDA